MKKEYTISQQFALISLDSLSCSHRSTAKCAAVRGIAVAKLLEKALFMQEDMPDVKEFQERLKTGIAAIKSMKKKEMDGVEKETADMLLADGGMEIAPDLLGCDMNYYTASVSLKSYRSDRGVYLSIVERLRAEILEEGPITLECACLLWLIRESGCMHDIFSVREQEQIWERMAAFVTEKTEDESAGIRRESAEADSVGSKQELSEATDDKTDSRQELTDEDQISMIWGQEFHRGIEQMIKAFLKGKRELFKNPYLEGINLLFPFLDRRQAIFVDFVIFGTDVKQRRQAMIEFLSGRGHHVEEVRRGTETLLRIDNMYYRVWPKTVSVGRIPVQGASLLPVYQ